MVTLPEVDEDQEEALRRVLEIRCKELMQDDDTERKQSVHVAAPDALFLNPSTDKSDNSQKTNLLAFSQAVFMISPFFAGKDRENLGGNNAKHCVLF